MYVNDKCPCGNPCCANGTCAACAHDAIDAGVADHGASSGEGCCGGSCAGGGCGSAPAGHLRSPWMQLVALALILFLGTLIAKNIKLFRHVGEAPRTPRDISITGFGKVTATPDIAVTSVGLVTEKADVAAAQTENSEKMNRLIASMKALGIAADDIKTTQYQIYPKYSYDDKKGSQINGYTVTQSVEVKIRDLKKISQVLAKAGEAGANQVSGIQFTIDEPKNLREKARDDALKDAKEKAARLAEQLGVQLGDVIGFAETFGSGEPPMPMMYATKEVGYGGGGAPEVQGGTLDIESKVTITYELK